MSQVTSPPGVDPSISDGPFDASGPMDDNFATSTGTVSASGISPYLYFYFVTMLWVLMFLIWVVLLVLRNRRVEQWGKQPAPQGEDTSVSEGGADHPPQTNTSEKFQRQQSNAQMIILVLLIVASLLALSLAIVTHFSCDFISLDTPALLDWIPAGRREDGSFVQIELTSIGLWSFGSSNVESYLEPNYFLIEGQENNACFDPGSDEPYLLALLQGGSAEFEAARVSSVLASILGGSSLLFFIWSACYPSRRTRVRYLGLPLFLATVFQLVPFVLFETELCTSGYLSGGCSLSFGGTTNVTAVMFWFFCTMVASAFPPMVTVQQASANEQPNFNSEP